MIAASEDLVGKVLVCTRRGDVSRVVDFEAGPPPCLWLRGFFRPSTDTGAWAAHNGTLVDYELVSHA